MKSEAKALTTDPKLWEEDRGSHHPTPGDLKLDVALPNAENVFLRAARMWNEPTPRKQRGTSNVGRVVIMDSQQKVNSLKALLGDKSKLRIGDAFSIDEINRLFNIPPLITFPKPKRSTRTTKADLLGQLDEQRAQIRRLRESSVKDYKQIEEGNEALRKANFNLIALLAGILLYSLWRIFVR